MESTTIMNNSELARILLDVIAELAKANIINQKAWQDDVKKLMEFTNKQGQ